MIIRDLEHYEVGSQVNQFEEIEGASWGFLELSVDNLTVGPFTGVESFIETINQTVGNPTIFGGVLTTTGFSVRISSVASFAPVVPE